MIIHQINIVCVTFQKAENNPPVTGNGYAPVSFQFPPQGVKTISRQVKIRRVLRSIQMTKHIRNPSRLIGAYAARVVILKNAF